MRAIVYSRVSTDAQERDGTSLDTQERAGIAFVEQQPDWVLLECIRDTASGYSLDRPGIARVRQLLRQGAVGVVVAFAVDRLSRHQTKLAVLLDEVDQADARLEFVTEKFEDTAMGRLIMSVRGFAAELEREKIAERTMRGKLERARSGRIPQGMGRGTYGYVYEPKSGRREIEPFQAEVVRRIFERYAETRSFSAVSNELNDAGVPAREGGRWYPLTIRNLLLNESYAGRLFYGKTSWAASRNPKTGKRRRRPTERAREAWIEMEGACPRIIDELLWARVQAIFAERERSPRQPAMRTYPLRGRLKCGVCGSAMVGQTMTSKEREYRYYGCRHIYDRRTGHDCTARYVRAQVLEEGLWHEVRRVLTDPRIVFSELTRQGESAIDPAELESLQRKVASLGDREQRLVRLYTFGEIDDAIYRQERATILRERAVLEERLRSLQPSVAPTADSIDEVMLARACAAVAAWLDQSDDQDRQQALEALQIAIVATRDAATVSGVIPVEVPEFFTLQRASA